MRGLAPTLVTEAGLDLAVTSARLREAVRDPDRRVRTEALRSLVLYDDTASVDVVMGALDSADTWMSVSAAEASGRFKSRADVVVPKLVASAGAGRPLSLRITTLAPLAALSPEAAADAAAGLVRAESAVARATATQVLQKLGPVGRTKLDALGVQVPAIPSAPGERPAPIKRTPAQYRASRRALGGDGLVRRRAPARGTHDAAGRDRVGTQLGRCAARRRLLRQRRGIRRHRWNRVRACRAKLRRATASDSGCRDAARRGQPARTQCAAR